MRVRLDGCHQRNSLILQVDCQELQQKNSLSYRIAGKFGGDLIWRFGGYFCVMSLRSSVGGVWGSKVRRSAEKRLDPVTVQRIVPFLRRNKEHAAEIFLGTWPTMVSPRMTATAYRSLSLPVSRLHGNSSPTLGVHVSL